MLARVVLATPRFLYDCCSAAILARAKASGVRDTSESALTLFPSRRKTAAGEPTDRVSDVSKTSNQEVFTIGASSKRDGRSRCRPSERRVECIQEHTCWYR